MPQLPLNDAKRVMLEQFVDSHGLAHVVEALATIALEKADHVQHTWQDNALARAWRQASKTLDRAAGKVGILP